MGHFGGRPREEERAGAGKHKRVKEMHYHRIKNDSPAIQSIADRKQRLKGLQHAFEQQRNPIKREQLYLQWTNLAASCPLEVFKPEDVNGIERLSALSNPEALMGLARNNPGIYSGSPFLPIHHLVKLMGKKTEKVGDRYVHLLGITEDSSEDASTINLRALEIFLLNFSAMVLPGHSLSLEIDKKTISVSYNDDPHVRASHNVHLTGIKRLLETKGIRASTPYFASRVYSGNNKIDSKLIFSTESRVYSGKEFYSGETIRRDVLVSMIKTID